MWYSQITVTSIEKIVNRNFVVNSNNQNKCVNEQLPV